MDDFKDSSDVKRRGGWRRFLKRVFLFLGGLLLGALFMRWQVGRVADHHLEDISARLDEAEPGWRVEDIEAARQKAAPPPELNPSNLIRELRKTLPNAWEKHRELHRGELGPPSRYQPTILWDLMWLLSGDDMSRAFRDRLLSQLTRPEILKCPAGYYHYDLIDNPLQMLLPHLKESRVLVDALDYDSRVSLLKNDANRAIRCARASLVVVRAIGDEPILISQFVRMSEDEVAVRITIQALDWGVPGEGLAELQQELLTEADVPWMQYALRGERAFINKLFNGLRSGKIDYDQLADLAGGKEDVLQSIGYRFYKVMLPGDQAKALEILSQYLEASKLPPHEQKAALASIKMPPRPPEDFRYIGTNLLVPACGSLMQRSLRCRAELLTGAVAIACERYRQKMAKWPDNLGELVSNNYLRAIPTDPYNDLPIQYKNFGDHIEIWSVGDLDDKDVNNGFQPHDDSRLDPKTDLRSGLRGWMLWNPQARLAPRPQLAPVPGAALAAPGKP